MQRHSYHQTAPNKYLSRRHTVKDSIGGKLIKGSNSLVPMAHGNEYVLSLIAYRMAIILSVKMNTCIPVKLVNNYPNLNNFILF